MPLPPFPPPFTQAAATELDADLAVRGIRVRCRAQWELFDWAQDVFTVWASPELSPRDGANVGFGFNVYWLREDEPGGYTVLAADYRGDADTDRTDDLSEALWIHSCQSQLMEITGAPIVVSRMDHLIDITPAARAALDDPDALLAMIRQSEPRPTDGGVHAGWTIVHVDDPQEITAELVVQVPCTELAHRAPALTTALALPPNHLVTCTPRTLTSVQRLDGQGGPQELARFEHPGRRPEPALVTVSHDVRGTTLVGTVAAGYEAEAMDVLRMFDQFADGLRDNFATYFGFWFVLIRQEGEAMRVKTLDLTQPGVGTTTTDLTQAAVHRRNAVRMYRTLGDVAWQELGCTTQVRVHPGAFDRPERVMRRYEPRDDKDSGWVVGDGPGEPIEMPAHELYRAAPELVWCFFLPPGYEVTARGGDIVRVVDPTGMVRYPAAGAPPR